MSTASNKELVIRFYEALQRKDFDVIEKLCHKDFVFYPQIDTPYAGVAGFIDAEKKHLDAFDGFTMPVNAMFAEGDQVAAFLVFEGTQSGEFLGVPPAGKTVRMSLMMLLRITDGKIVEKRAHYDKYDIFRQLGVPLLA